MIRKKKTNNAFTLVEVMVMTLLLGIVMTAASMVFLCGQNLFLFTSTQSDLQANVVQALKRIGTELENSGHDGSGNLKFSVLDNAGQFSTDILRFSIPICICGVTPIDSSGNVAYWGAPLIWGQNGCSSDYASYPVGGNGKVDICHIPPGNPNNAHTLNVSPNAVNAHLAHGDYLGSCNACSLTGYTNQTIEYIIDANHQLLRRVLNSAAGVVNSAVMAQQVSGFQAVVSNDQKTIKITIQATGTAERQRVITITNSVSVLLKNG